MQDQILDPGQGTGLTVYACAALCRDSSALTKNPLCHQFMAQDPAFCAICHVSILMCEPMYDCCYQDFSSVADLVRG